MILNATSKIKNMHARRNPNNLSVSSAAYAQLSPSITSATFLSPTVASRRGLLSPSPPPSPNLPSLIPRHGKKVAPSSHSGLVKRILIGIASMVFLIWLIVRNIYISETHSVESGSDSEEWEMVGGNSLPKEPSAVAVQDSKGNSRWTISIPASYDFPLQPAQYRDVCHQSMELSKQLRQEFESPSSVTKRMLGYYAKDKYYMEVEEAEEQALLPPCKGEGRPRGFVDDEAIAAKKDVTALKVCDRTLTYVMETEDAGFGNTLLRLWMSYGLATKENRTFFIDDTRWPYGKYSSYFLPPPAAGCRPPPKTHMVPCPHNSRHLVVSGATVAHTFGHAFIDEWEDARKMRVQRQHKIFGLLRTGYEALFNLRADDAKYVQDRNQSLYEPITKDGGLSMGIHVRRGDKHPYEFQYQEDYIPLNRYMDTARETYINRVENTGGDKEKRHSASKIIIASDDPTVYESAEMGPNAVRAQDRILLATKQTLEAAQGKKNPWIDEITGWEGGFYHDVFYSLGRPVGNAGDMNGLDPNVLPQSALNIRELVGRAYLMDLALVGKADTVICTVSSVGCRILAVMMGWDSAINKGNWKNIDGDFDWRGIDW